MRWNAILFDLDDTLYSLQEAFQLAMTRLVEVQIKPLTDDSVDEIKGRIAIPGFGTEQPPVGNKPPRLKPPEILVQRAKESYPQIPHSTPVLAKWLRDQFIAQIRPDPALKPILSTLDEARVPWAIVTNGDEFQLRKIKSLGINLKPEHIIMSEIEGWQKPDSRLFHLALDRLGIGAGEEVLMIGDNPVADIEGAEGAGLQSAWMRLGRQWPVDTHEPDIVLDSLEELLPHLQPPSH